MSIMSEKVKMIWGVLGGKDIEEVPEPVHPVYLEKDIQENALVQLIKQGRSSCPFYGLVLIDRYFMEGSEKQCGKLNSFTHCCTDCYLERAGKVPCWKTCKYNIGTIEKEKIKFQLARVCLDEFGDKWISFESWMEYFRNNYEIE